MSIVTACSACHSEFRLHDDLGGKTIRCPNCQAPMAVPPALASGRQRVPAPQPPSALVSPWSDAPAPPEAAPAPLPTTSVLLPSPPLDFLPAALPTALAPLDDFLDVRDAATMPSLPARSARAPSTSRGRKKPSKTPLKIAAVALAVVAFVGALGALAVVLVRGGFKGNGGSLSDSPISTWMPDPARTATFTKELSIGRYVFKAPDSMDDGFQHEGLIAGVKNKHTTWRMFAPVADILTLDVDVKEYPGSWYEKETTPQELLTVYVDEIIEKRSSRENMISMKRTDCVEGTIGGLPFAVVRLEETIRYPGGTIRTNYKIMAFHYGQHRTVNITATTYEPPGSGNFSILEAILLTFQQRPGQ